MGKTDEQYVMFGHLPDDGAAETTVRQVQRDLDLSAANIADGVPKFIPNQSFTTFSAEHMMQDGNLVIHFFMPSGPFGMSAEEYWKVRFPKHLDSVARNYFNANAPRLQAKYTEEVNSWWFRANGYEHIIDLPAFIDGFYEALDASLDPRA
jgi:hypothetical protein